MIFLARFTFSKNKKWPPNFFGDGCIEQAFPNAFLHGHILIPTVGTEDSKNIFRREKTRSLLLTK
jgi:hypothetical protein